MAISSKDFESDEVRRMLEQVIRGTKSTLAMLVVERETTTAALAQLDGEEFDHYQNTLKMYENEILFNRTKLAVAEAELKSLT